MRNAKLGDVHTGIVFSDSHVTAYKVRVAYVLFPLLSVLPSLIDRLGDAKDQVRDQDQMLLLKIMEQAANPQVAENMGNENMTIRW